MFYLYLIHGLRVHLTLSGEAQLPQCFKNIDGTCLPTSKHR